MHIPSSMLSGPICPVTAGIAATGIAAAAYFASKSEDKPSAGKFAAVAALIFAGQMMNFPIQNGTSGHLLGGVIASALLGTPFGILATAMVVTVQCLVFSDGGLSVLGANLLNMALLGAGVCGIGLNYLKKHMKSVLSRNISTAAIAWLSIVAASFMCSIELAISGTIAFGKVVPAMFGVHALIGIVEGVVTVVLVSALSMERVRSSRRGSIAIPLLAASIIALLLSPFASGFPDGLEYVAQQYNFLHESAPAFTAPFADYTVKGISQEAISTGIAGLIGVMITFVSVWAVGLLFRPGKVSS